MTRSVAYTSSPLLASKTPVWRSKMIVAVIAFSFLGLAARAAWVQVIGNDFFQRQGEGIAQAYDDESLIAGTIRDR